MYHGQPDRTKLDLIAGDRKSNEVRIKTTLANRLTERYSKTKAFALKLLSLLYI